MLKNMIKGAALLLLALSLSGCFEPEGTLRVKADRAGLDLFVDGEHKLALGDSYVELKLKVGERKIEVKGISEDEEWRYTGTEMVTVVKDTLIEKTVQTDRTETEKRLNRIALEKKQRLAKSVAEKTKQEWARRLAEGVEGANHE